MRAFPVEGKSLSFESGSIEEINKRFIFKINAEFVS